MDFDVNEGVFTVPLLNHNQLEQSELDQLNGADPFSIPYRSVLSFAPLIDKIEHGLAAGVSDGHDFLIRELRNRLKHEPALRQPIPDLEILKTSCQETLGLMMVFLFPPAMSDRKFKISLPFSFESFYSSPAMEKLMERDEVCYTFGKFAASLRSINLVQAGLLILQQCYGKELEINPATLLKTTARDTGLVHYYKPEMNTEFIRVVVEGELPELSEADYHRLLKNLYDREIWLELLPPETFSFEGFMFGQLNEVTREEALSQLKQKLLHREAVLDVEKVRELADLLRLYFGMPDLQFGLTAVDFPLELTVDHKYKIQYNLLSDEFESLTDPAHINSVYMHALRQRDIVLVEDLAALSEHTELEEALLRKGIGSLLIAPLMNKKNQVIGLVELAAPQPFQLNAFTEVSFRELTNLFRMTVARSREDVDNRLEAIMREQYTSLHPSVEWRFMEAAYKILEQQSREEEVVPEQISFKSVYPFYGQADIVGSSQLRNEAIYGDLVDNLKAARLVLVRATELINFPLASHMIMEIDEALAIDSSSFNNSHETLMVELLLREINPLIELIGRDQQSLKPLVKEYFLELDDDLQLIYRQRKAYEESVNILNKELGSFFENRDKVLQMTLPHYFEQYKTDGVEYEIYAGESLLRKQEFGPIHLRNLRLSQLLDMADATRLVSRVSEQSPIRLETAQLVFAYTSPLNITFRMDEKRFDVDGAYNVRYEILKKRIDKATINGGEERLTRAGHVSIVYLHEKDHAEYKGYLQYLRSMGYVDGDVEELLLDPLQSVQGLRALRFKVKT